jgi:hypothetical protein
MRGELQRTKRRGKDAVMVLSEECSVALITNAKKIAPNFIAHLFALPRERGAISKQIQPQIMLRDLAL